MKKLILFLSLILSVGFASAQSEIPSDSIRRAPSTNIKEFGGFLLDMGLMNVATPELPKFNLEMPNMTKDYNQLFRLNTDVTYSQGFTDSFLRLLSLVFLASATDMVGDCPLLHSLCRWDLSN